MILLPILYKNLLSLKLYKGKQIQNSTTGSYNLRDRLVTHYYNAVLKRPTLVPHLD